MHHGLCGSPGAGHLDSFQVFAVENVCAHASLGARFPWLIEKDRCCASLSSLLLYQHHSIPSHCFTLPHISSHPIFIPRHTLLSTLSHPFLSHSIFLQCQCRCLLGIRSWVLLIFDSWRLYRVVSLPCPTVASD